METVTFLSSPCPFRSCKRSKAKQKHSIIASEETIALANLAGEFISLPQGARLLNAGHILGSRQLLVEDEQSGEISVYTGIFPFQII